MDYGEKITVEIGTKNPHSPTSYFGGDDRSVVSGGGENDNDVHVTPIEKVIVSASELDKMLKQFESELQQIPQPLQVSQNSLEQAEFQRRILIEHIAAGFMNFLNLIKSRALKSASQLPPVVVAKDQDILTSTITTIEGVTPPIAWEHKKNELQQALDALNAEEKQCVAQINQDLVVLQSNSNVFYHLAKEVNNTLDALQQLYTIEFALLRKVYTQQSRLFSMIGQSYVTFYAWLLAQWERHMTSIASEYDTVHKQMEHTFDPHAMHGNIEALLLQYEQFLALNRASLPAEFRLTEETRKKWRHFLGLHQPEECIRLLKTELLALQKVPALDQSTSAWLRELDHYNVSLLQRQSESKRRAKKRMEDTLSSETNRAFYDKWNTFTSNLFTIGINLQKEAAQKLQHMNSVFAQKQAQIVKKRAELLTFAQQGEASLALAGPTVLNLARNIEHRRHLLTKAAHVQYSIIAIDSLLTLHQIATRLDTEFAAFLNK